MTEAGTYFIDRYRVVDEIGVGGMASVHLARMDGLGGFQKWAAIKKIHPHLIEDDSFVSMFLDEARVAARISHPNVAMVFDVGKHEDTYWIAMEYLHGEPLREVMRRTEEIGQPIPPEIACKIVADAAEGLHAAHELQGKGGEKLGLVHRDVTPHNIFVTYDGVTKVVDFGIAKFSSRLAGATRAGTLKGKLAYMSPEQVQGETIDRRTDIFALGVVLWELTTGQRLFRMDNDLDTLAKVQECNVPRPSTIVRGYPMDLEKVVLKALVKNRGERYRTAREFSRALQSFFLRRGLFIASDEVSSFIGSVFKDRLEKRDEHLRWAAEVTQTVNIDQLRAQQGAPPEPAPDPRNAAPRPAAGLPAAAPSAPRPPAAPASRAGAPAAPSAPRPMSRMPTQIGGMAPPRPFVPPARASAPDFHPADAEGPTMQADVDDPPTLAASLANYPAGGHLDGALPPPDEDPEDATIVDDAVSADSPYAAALAAQGYGQPMQQPEQPMHQQGDMGGFPRPQGPLQRTLQMQEHPGFLNGPQSTHPMGPPPMAAPPIPGGQYNPADPFAMSTLPEASSRAMHTVPRLTPPLPPTEARTVTGQAIKQRRSKKLALFAAGLTVFALVATVALFMVLRNRGGGGATAGTPTGTVAKGPLSAARIAFSSTLAAVPAGAAAPVENPAIPAAQPEPTPEPQPTEAVAPEPPAQPVEPEPVAKPEPAPKPEPAAKPEPKPAPAAATSKPATTNNNATAANNAAAAPAGKPTPIKGTGTLTIVCLPKCSNIFDNGAPLGPGPINKRAVTAGAHSIRFVGVDPTKKKTVSVNVPANGHQDVRQFVN